MGIGLVPWLWGTRVRILFVIDGRITEGRGPEEFGLGLVLDTLRDPSFAWWVRFDVEVANRNNPTGFRFTEQGFDIDAFDQVWFFGDFPGEVANDPAYGDEIIEEDGYFPLGDAELRVLAEWMERGGGVFATGDHALLGASMCYRIPRVRTMRKWTRAQGVPSFADDDRHETLQHRGKIEFLSAESDRWPQRIVPVYQRDPGQPLIFGQFHPLLCGETGVIDRFPDHMHEGVVIEDDDVQLNEPLGIPGFDGVEYPVVPQVVAPVTTVGLEPFGLEPFGLRPRPHVIARGWTTNEEVDPKLFGLIGVYDGDSVKLGRVVVDSTWHHWFSMNLVGFRDDAPDIYRGMQSYYRNVALWLSTPEQRAAMLFAAAWGVLVGKQPGALSKVMGIWGIGERVVDVIGRTAPQCIVSELVATFLGNSLQDEAAPSRQPPQAARVPPLTTMVNQAIVGGIASQLLELAHNHILERAHGRKSALDEDAIRSRGLAGVADGQRQLIAALDQGASELKALRDELKNEPESSRFGEIPIHGDSWEAELAD